MPGAWLRVQSSFVSSAGVFVRGFTTFPLVSSVTQVEVDMPLVAPVTQPEFSSPCVAATFEVHSPCAPGSCTQLHAAGRRS